MSAEAIAEIKRLQPYRNGKKAKHTTLYLLSSLDNVVSTVTARGKRLEFAMPDWADGTAAFVEDGAVVAHFGEKPGTWTTTTSNLLIPSPPLQESEVNVEVSGTPRVAIKIVDEEVGSKVIPPPGFMPFDALLDAILWDCRNNWIPTLERFVRKRP